MTRELSRRPLRLLFPVILIAGLIYSTGAQMLKPAGRDATAGIIPTGFGEAVDRDVARARAATAKFKSLGKAVAAGYAREVSHCIDNPPQGAMGFHHKNGALYDAKLEVEKPEILLYARAADGAYKLTGVEYIVPTSAWSSEEPPVIMGQKLKHHAGLKIWYLHVWVWEPNPSGIFADWNPRVKCAAAATHEQ